MQRSYQPVAEWQNPAILKKGSFIEMTEAVYTWGASLYLPGGDLYPLPEYRCEILNAVEPRTECHIGHGHTCIAEAVIRHAANG